MERKYFTINGYFKDGGNFEGYTVASTPYDPIADASIDEGIFFYGLTEEDIQKAIELGEKFEEDFVITSYEK